MRRFLSFLFLSQLIRSFLVSFLKLYSSRRLFSVLFLYSKTSPIEFFYVNLNINASTNGAKIPSAIFHGRCLLVLYNKYFVSIVNNLRMVDIP